MISWPSSLYCGIHQLSQLCFQWGYPGNIYILLVNDNGRANLSRLSPFMDLWPLICTQFFILLPSVIPQVDARFYNTAISFIATTITIVALWQCNIALILQLFIISLGAGAVSKRKSAACSKLSLIVEMPCIGVIAARIAPSVDIMLFKSLLTLVCSFGTSYCTNYDARTSSLCASRCLAICIFNVFLV